MSTTPFALFGITDFEASQDVRDRLRHRGVDVVACTSSQEFLEVAKRRVPSVIVLDDALETVGGQVLIRLLRGSLPDVPVILLLPPGSLPDRDGCPHLGPVCTLVSPVPEQDLWVVIASALESRGRLGSAAAPPVILCVDDDVQFLKSLVRILRRRGYSVVGYDNTEQALEAIPIHRPSLLFVDVLMPGMNGLDLVSEVRESYGTSIPIVLISAKNEDGEILEGYRTGARYYITKPCEPQKVLDVADYLVGRLGPRERELLGSKL